MIPKVSVIGKTKSISIKLTKSIPFRWLYPFGQKSAVRSFLIFARSTGSKIIKLRLKLKFVHRLKL